jgi:NitT/TauT family transport system permease protein
LTRARRVWTFALALILVGAVWELYKVIGPEDGGTAFGWTILPRANDTAMPHVWEMFSRYGQPENRASDTPILVVVLRGAWFTFRIALAGLALGTAVGLGLAVLMARYKVVERGLLPYLVLSQTVPLIAVAPLVVSWGGRLHVGAFLAFFPVAVGTLKGLTSTPPASLELMDSFAASWRQTLFKLRFPAALPFIVPSLKLAATASVVGVVVAEISTGLAGGIGRLIIEYAREATSDPAKVFTAVFGAAALGLVMAAIVAVVDLVGMRNRPREATE